MVTCSSFVYGLCLATIGVAFFGAVTSVAALFIYIRKKECKWHYFVVRLVAALMS